MYGVLCELLHSVTYWQNLICVCVCGRYDLTEDMFISQLKITFTKTFLTAFSSIITSAFSWLIKVVEWWSTSSILGNVCLSHVLSLHWIMGRKHLIALHRGSTYVLKSVWVKTHQSNRQTNMYTSSNFWDKKIYFQLYAFVRNIALWQIWLAFRLIKTLITSYFNTDTLFRNPVPTVIGC